MDDFSPDTGKFLADYLKHWADRYPFRGETKGSSRLIRPRLIIVTSNYRLEDCFERHEDIQALKRRFMEHTVESLQEFLATPDGTLWHDT